MAGKEINIKTTEEIKVPEKLIDQVIGQEKAINIIKKAAGQRRNVILIGVPGTGKSMLAQSLADLLSKKKLSDILCLPNPADTFNPKIQEVPTGMGKKIVGAARAKSMGAGKEKFWLLFLGFIILSNVISYAWNWIETTEQSDILIAADRVTGMVFLVSALLMFIIYFASYQLAQSKQKVLSPKLLIDNSKKESAPFIDATGVHAGALLGDVLHDPFQTGGLGTPAHERVMPGALHKAHKGVLFIDEVATLKPEMQVEILSAMQEKKMAITGRSERSAGAMVKTDPVPCDFILVAAGNLQTIQKMHPALRSRIRGYGYEIYMNSKLKDTAKNREKIARVIAQEVIKDKKIPHFKREAVLEIIKESRRRAGRKGYLTLKIRDLGGLIRAAGDVAKERKHKHVHAKDVKDAVELSGTLEQQISKEFTEEKKEYQIILNKGSKIGRVNGLAVLGTTETYSGIILPIESSVTRTMDKGKMIATGKLGKIAKEAIENVGAVIKKYSGKDLSRFDIHVQFLQTYEGVEGDSASISVAAAVISSLESVPVNQDTAMTGSLTIRGGVLPVGGINAKIEAAIDAGMKKVIIPKANEQDVLEPRTKKIKIIPVSNVSEVIEKILDWKGKKNKLRQIQKRLR
ncbi:MAG: ATP-dependent protease LonB [Nanoarchaeota archaeon]|nr:ATP-dependent protease LonB [Nanoarchaeota archaeon]